MTPVPLDSESDVAAASRGSEPLSLLRLFAFGSVYAFLFVASGAWLVRPAVYELDGASGHPTIADGDRLLVDFGAYGWSVDGAPIVLARHTTPEVGELVILVSPMDDNVLMKRVVGIAGDRIAFRGHRLVRNGRLVSGEETRPCPTDIHTSAQCRDESLGDARYSVAWDPASPSPDRDEIVVPPGSVYVLGDHRDHSNDSRFFDPVPLARVLARVRYRVSARGLEVIR